MYTNFIYIGPTVPLLGLKQWTLYRVPDPPMMMKEYIDKTPLLNVLYIPTAELPVARKNLKTNPQSAESLAFDAFSRMINKLPR